MSGFCLAATVGHAGLWPWLAQRLQSDGMYTTLPISTTVVKEQSNRRAELGRPKSLLPGKLLTDRGSEIGQFAGARDISAPDVGHPVRGSNYYQGDKTRKVVPFSAREQKRAIQNLSSSRSNLQAVLKPGATTLSAMRFRRTDMRKLELCGLTAITFITLTAPAFAQGDAAKGKAAFAKCGICHQVGPGAKNLVGPQLNGVVGRKAASVGDYTMYSAGMKKLGEQGFVWNEQNIDKWIADPKAMIPDSPMALAFQGVPDAGERTDIIAYLKTNPAQ